jgi:hypothetical protein
MAAMAVSPQRNFLNPPTPEDKAQQQAERARRRTELVALMQSVFGLALAEWGDEEGRRQWRKVGDRRGRARGSTTPLQDRILLRIFDVMAAEPGQDIKRLPRKVATRLAQKPGRTAQAIEKQLRRLLNQRRAQAVGNALSWHSRDR